MANYRKGARLMKHRPGLLVRPLWRRLRLAKEEVGTDKEIKIIDQISKEVENTLDFLDRFQNWELETAGHFQRIQRHINKLIQDKNSEIGCWDAEKNLENELYGLRHYTEHLGKVHLLPHEALRCEKARCTIRVTSNIRSYQENEIPINLNFLHSWDPKMKSCLYSLILFPENTELKKRLVIYWWIGLGLEPFPGDTSSTERCELFFSYLVDMGVLIPKYKKHNKLAINRCIIEPTIHKLLISACDLIRSDEREGGTWKLYDGDKKVLLNLDQSYLNSKEISNNHDLWVVQLGFWECPETETKSSPRKKRDSRIEVDETYFLNNLGENVTYLSLRGISGIEELHESIGKLENLMILDLNTCRQLEKLPQKPRSISKQKLIRWALPQASWFKKLIVLDMSGCYLLDHHMPKWICEISNLEVLKGFVVGRVENKNRSCRLHDLSKLNKLRKLSIRIARGGTVDLSVLQPLDRLLVLTIIWEGNMRNNYISASSLPKNIEKLDIRCYPEPEALELLNPAKLKNLKRLYIRGGKLTKIPCEDNWEVEILRLRFLQYLEYPTWEKLKCSFKNLRYVEYVQCPRLRGFPKDGSSWSMESDEPFQRDNASETSNE